MTDSYIYNGGLRFIIRDNRRILQQSSISSKGEIHWQDVPCVDEVKDNEVTDKQVGYN